MSSSRNHPWNCAHAALRSFCVTRPFLSLLRSADQTSVMANSEVDSDLPVKCWSKNSLSSSVVNSFTIMQESKYISPAATIPVCPDDFFGRWPRTQGDLLQMLFGSRKN